MFDLFDKNLTRVTNNIIVLNDNSVIINSNLTFKFCEGIKIYDRRNLSPLYAVKYCNNKIHDVKMLCDNMYY